MAQLDLGTGSGTDVLNGIVNYLSAGGSITRVITASMLGTIVSPFLAIGDIVDGIGTFFSTPFREGGDAIGALFNALLTAPANLLRTGANVTEDTLTIFLGDSLAGLLALPIATGMVLLSLWFIAMLQPVYGSAGRLLVDVPTLRTGASTRLRFCWKSSTGRSRSSEI